MPTAAAAVTPARPVTIPSPCRADAALRLDPKDQAELRAHCRRMLGSSSEVDDAVQETLLRAWRNIDRFEGRSSVRTWLRCVATNVCLDMLRAPQRRARPTADAFDDVAGAAAPPGPGETVIRRDEVRQAFVVALGGLPPRQRTVLVLREVFGWRAAEVAELLGVSVASVNSALQRARATLDEGRRAARHPATTTPGMPRHDVLARSVDAFERHEVEALASLLLDEHAGRDRQRRTLA